MEFPQSSYLVPILVIVIAGAYIGFEWWRRRRAGKRAGKQNSEDKNPKG